MTAPRSTCPDCSTEMQPIQLIGEHGGGGLKPITYAAADAKGGFWGQIPSSSALGTVKGHICPECGRIVLHGEKASAT